jgi:hypothetical protein
MTYKATGPWIGAQALDDTRTTAEHILGTRIKGVSATLGEGEFIYLKGVASTVAGNAVVYDEAFATTRTVAASRGPVAIAMSANVANQYGWYQIAGTAVASALTVSADALVSLSATDGSLDDLTTAQYLVTGARWMSATDTPSTGKAYCALSYPQAAGITGIA